MSLVFGLMLFVLVGAYAFGVNWNSKGAEVVRKNCPRHADEDAEF
jgi:hypothetical protein|tara:strand:+ start:664 stop:798 length:135 start_codon:yes stop_codon:yes gene_type:complete